MKPIIQQKYRYQQLQVTNINNKNKQNTENCNSVKQITVELEQITVELV